MPLRVEHLWPLQRTVPKPMFKFCWQRDFLKLCNWSKSSRISCFSRAYCAIYVFDNFWRYCKFSFTSRFFNNSYFDTIASILFLFRHQSNLVEVLKIWCSHHYLFHVLEIWYSDHWRSWRCWKGRLVLREILNRWDFQERVYKNLRFSSGFVYLHSFVPKFD